MHRTFVTVLLVLVLCGCSTTAKLYSLDTGEVIHASFENLVRGHGRIQATLADGQVMEGEYSTIGDTSLLRFTATGQAWETDGYAWAAAQGFSFNQPGKKYGRAALVGGGRVIDFVYAVSPVTSDGHGIGRDNEGNLYKIVF